MKKLSPTLRSLLEEIARENGLVLPDLSAGAGVQWTESERERLVNVITQEFTKTGLRPDDEPNERGLQLEELSDWVRGSN